MQQTLCRKQYILIVFIASLLLAGIPAALAANEANDSIPYGGTITVLSYPPGAAVFLNGEYRNNTPATFLNVPPGKYQINVTLAGYKEETFTTAIINGSKREIGVNLENLSSAPAPTLTYPGVGSIAVDSNPGGASVSLDGKAVGSTPVVKAALVLNAVPSGNHTVTVELRGYPVYTSTVTVTKNHVVKVSADFVPRTPEASGSAALPVTTPATTAPPVPLSPLTAAAAAGLAGLAAVLRRS